ncbi:hypothetical protein FRC02_001442 [Tulasnella sp. 418]|nr:hypothetical protein FRC02_001442 [Tulasnella sp. 418]
MDHMLLIQSSFENLPIAAITMSDTVIYFFELHTAAYLYRYTIAPDIYWYGTNDGKSLYVYKKDTHDVGRLSVNTKDIIEYVRQVLKNDVLASGIAIRGRLPGAEDVIFNEMHGEYRDIAQLEEMTTTVAE